MTAERLPEAKYDREARAASWASLQLRDKYRTEYLGMIGHYLTEIEPPDPEALPQGRDAANLMLDIVASVTGVPPPQLIGRRRERRFVKPRHILFYLIREATEGEMSFPEIGSWALGRDHTTIMNSVNNAAPLLLNDPKWAAIADRARTQYAARIGPIEIEEAS